MLSLVQLALMPNHAFESGRANKKRAFFAVLGMGWLFAGLWLPRYARSRLAHLPNRRVRVEASATVLAFQTATERLEVA